ncbi:hypothetical protein F5Y06DRAFT_300564 [Hypoxylon sp. FL0890]|nr:hypothetical protein F5Y06DRAFT_300564 [Hypoxylon sp. FL0890]
MSRNLKSKSTPAAVKHDNDDRENKMKSAFAVILATLMALTAAAPLNINLGAYSPALVVGDGAIGFNGGEGEAATQGAAALEGQGIASN